MRFYIRKTTGESVPIYYDIGISKTQKIRGLTNEKMNPIWNPKVIDKNGIENIKTTVDLKFEHAQKGSKAKAKETRRALEDFEEFAEKELSDLKKDNPIDLSEQLKTKIDVFFNRITLMDDDDIKPFYKFMQHVIETKSNEVSKKTVQDYQRLLKLLKEFEKSHKTRLSYDSINMTFYNKFRSFLENVKHYKPNTVGKHFKNIKAIMNESLNMGFHSNLNFKLSSFKVTQESANAIYLNEYELEKIEVVKAEDRMAAARDYFLLMAYTGLRPSDVFKLTEENIVYYDGERMISYQVNKTKVLRAFNITDKIHDILERWNGSFPNDSLTQKAYDAQVNLDIKTIARRAKIKKYKLVTNYCGRRSFCTNEYLKGTPVFEIMQQSGHETLKNFKTYIKSTGLEVVAAITKRGDI